MFFATEVEVEEKVAAIDAGNLARTECLAFQPEAGFATAVVAVGLEDGLKLLGLSLQKKFQRGHVVKHHT
jgi:hypothetical protein